MFFARKARLVGVAIVELEKTANELCNEKSASQPKTSRKWKANFVFFFLAKSCKFKFGFEFESKFAASINNAALSWSLVLLTTTTTATAITATTTATTTTTTAKLPANELRTTSWLRFMLFRLAAQIATCASFDSKQNQSVFCLLFVCLQQKIVCLNADIFVACSFPSPQTRLQHSELAQILADFYLLWYN